MKPQGRLVLRGVAFEVLHNRFWLDGDRAGSLKVLGTELVRLKCWGQSWFASRNGGLSRKFTGCGLSRKLKMLGTELARFA